MTEYEQLMALKALTKETGVLHDAQVFQLKLWPLVMTHATKSEFTVDFDFKDIIFNITETKGKVPTQFTKRLKLLCKYTQNLLGEDWTVTVKLKNKPRYTLKGK
jgi:hypothetical protein